MLSGITFVDHNVIKMAQSLKVHGRLRDECLNETPFASLGHAREVLRARRDVDNHVQPRSGMGTG